ncbi:DNA-formamidopyrimidine glycosylase family protein [Actinoplanes sp. N902-109]|uniref:DNA-formamidopyrimidine glycosylase family protein n=1 Tax=Actinoplanes sp. (strain N902-109) TaxID=649831 RepID=UPI0003294BD4|nr:DNA-formamidopyrimidine glycosylase family protein [Actinoplanes sp. N902-109]AGL18023.1 DNA-(apurinic or apyrimidinic site) lyase [Actinoplanes sp. N902-109]
MAEGDSIRRLAGRLQHTYAGLPVLASEYRRGGDLPVRFTGDALTEVAAVGKHLLMRFAGGRTLHSHLRMQGSWRTHRPGWRPRPPASGRRDVVGAWFDFGTAGVLAAHDMPVLDVVPTSREHDVIGHLGPDILAADWPGRFPEAVANVRAAAGLPIRAALMDQRNLCGIGNLWAVESLFIGGIFPYERSARVDAAKLLDLTHRMMVLGLRNGTQATTGDLRRGRTHWVYGRYRRPCRRCGTPIAFRAAGPGPYDRETWWCPSCQPPSPDEPAALP